MTQAREKTSYKLLITLCSILLTAVSIPLVHAVPHNNSPSSVITEFDNAIMATMKAGGKAANEARYRIMFRAIHDTFDLPFIGQLLLGHYWSTLTPQQRLSFLSLFSKLIAATYAHNFNGYDGQQIRILRTLVHGGKAFVYTQFYTPGHGRHHEFDYVLREDGHHWLIVNVIADGVSDLAIKREEYQHFLRTGSYASLMAVMKRQAAMMAPH